MREVNRVQQNKNMEEKNKESQSQVSDEQPKGGQPSEGQGAGTAGETAASGAQKPLGTVSVLGREYNLATPEGIQALSRDYDRLGRQYAPLTQQLAELEMQIRSVKEQPASPDLSDPETVEYLRKLGYAKEDEIVEKVLKRISNDREDEMLALKLQELEKTYDGKDGRPKFDRMAVIDYCLEAPKLEDAYRSLNWDALKEWELRNAKKAPTAPPSSGGEGGPRQPQPKKRVFGPTGEGQVSIRDAILETLEQEAPKATA
jgi:hypothetical protein